MYPSPAGWSCHHPAHDEQIDTTDEALATAKMREGWIVLEIPSTDRGTDADTMAVVYGSERVG